MTPVRDCLYFPLIQATPLMIREAVSPAVDNETYGKVGIVITAADVHAAVHSAVNSAVYSAVENYNDDR